MDDATQVYERLGSGDLRGVGFLFKYDETAELPVAPAIRNEAQEPPAPKAGPVVSRRGSLPADKAIRIGFVGAGNYASSMLLPHIAGRTGTELARVATRRSLSAVNAKRRFSFTDAGTDTDAVLHDDSIDVVFIVTRHSSHASLTCEALRAGKTVFVEKPLALTYEELDKILETVDATGNDRLMVGFNRRFAPMLQNMRTALAGRRAPSWPGTLSMLGHCPLAAGTATRSLKGRGLSGRAATLSTPSAGGPALTRLR